VVEVVEVDEVEDSGAREHAMNEERVGLVVVVVVGWADRKMYET
jgi:hypothetical protein